MLIRPIRIRETIIDNQRMPAAFPRALTLSHVVMDEIWAPGATFPVEVIGGAGVHAVLGQALALGGNGIAMAVSGVGVDFPERVRRQLQEAGVDDRGLVPVVASTPRTVMRYSSQSERTETPAFGLDHFERCDPRISMVPESFRMPSSVYVFAGVTEPAWQVVDQTPTSTTVLWELDVSVCHPSFLPRIRERSARVDVVSLNEQELAGLVGPTEPAGLRRVLEDVFPHAAALALRRGADGAALATHDGLWTARPRAGGTVVDPTGAGNAFSGALSVSWCRSSADPAEALRVAMAAAAVTVARHGPVLPLSPEIVHGFDAELAGQLIHPLI
jgi:sugar/nucleoside kinase (ribokinase family)